MKTIRLFLTLLGLGALLGAASLAETGPAAGEGKPPSSDGPAKPDHHPANPAHPQTAGPAPAGAATVSDAIAMESQPKRNGLHAWKKQLQISRALITKKQATVLNTPKAKKTPAKPSLATTPHTPAKPWGITTAETHHPEATPWALPTTANPHDHLIAVAKEPALEPKTVKIESLPTVPAGIVPNESFTAHKINIDRQHTPGLIALGGATFSSAAHNTVALNGTGMKHKPF